MQSGLFNTYNIFSPKSGFSAPLHSLMKGILGNGNPMSLLSALSGANGAAANPFASIAGGLANANGLGSANGLGGLGSLAGLAGLNGISGMGNLGNLAGLAGLGGLGGLGNLAGLAGLGGISGGNGFDPQILNTILSNLTAKAAQSTTSQSQSTPPEEENIKDASYRPVEDDEPTATEETPPDTNSSQAKQTETDGSNSPPPFWQNLDPALLSALAQLLFKGSAGGGGNKTAANHVMDQEEDADYDPCRDCLCDCPRAAMRLPLYQEVRQMAANWRRY